MIFLIPELIHFILLGVSSYSARIQETTGLEIDQSSQVQWEQSMTNFFEEQYICFYYLESKFSNGSFIFLLLFWIIR